MIDFLAHEKGDLVGVATVDIKSGKLAKGVYMDYTKACGSHGSYGHSAGA